MDFCVYISLFLVVDNAITLTTFSVVSEVSTWPTFTETTFFSRIKLVFREKRELLYSVLMLFLKIGYYVSRLSRALKLTSLYAFIYFQISLKSM